MIIDGLNEASQSARNLIVADFLAQATGGRVAVSTQTKEFWPKPVRVLELLPLDEIPARQFLVLQGISEEQAQMVVTTATSMPNECDREAARVVLSNPLDLAVIAEMVKWKITPNLLTLPEQQYKTMATKFRERENYEFPLARFSDAVYEMVIADRQTIASKGLIRELKVMAEDRMVIDRNQIQTFRHNKVRDYFLVVALNRGDRISQHFGDRRFLSAYLSLAFKIPPYQAGELRESVEEWALDHNDRLLADELRRALRRRKGEVFLKGAEPLR